MAESIVRLSWVKLQDYKRHLAGLLYTHLRGMISSAKSFEWLPTKQEDEVIFRLIAEFRDNSRLRSIQTLRTGPRGIGLLQYNHSYDRESGFFFTYEMDRRCTASLTPPADFIEKPGFHLHVGILKEKVDQTPGVPEEIRGHGGPHYGTVPVALDDVLAVILVNYFEGEKDTLRKLELYAFRKWWYRLAVGQNGAR